MRNPILPAVDKTRNWRSYNPFLRPEWRWDRVLKLLHPEHGQKGRVTRNDDSYIRAAKSFLGHWQAAEDEAARNQLLYENPGMYYAYQIYEKAQNLEPETAFMLEAMLLADKSYEETAEALATCPEAVEYYEAVFFNVTPRLKNFAWITKHVLLPAADRFTPTPVEEDNDAPEDNQKRYLTVPVIKPHMDVTIKFFAYFGGGIMVDFMITGFRRGVFCTSQEDIAQWLNDQWMHQMGRRSAMAAGEFQVDKWSVEMLFNTHSRIIEIQRGAASQGEKQTAIEKHISLMLTELPWVHGDAAKEVFKGTEVGMYDDMAAELRDDELQLVASGQRPTNLEELPLLDITLKRGKEAKDGNPK